MDMSDLEYAERERNLRFRAFSSTLYVDADIPRAQSHQISGVSILTTASHKFALVFNKTKHLNSSLFNKALGFYVSYCLIFLACISHVDNSLVGLLCLPC